METLAIVIIALITGSAHLAFNRPEVWKRVGEGVIPWVWMLCGFTAGGLGGAALVDYLPGPPWVAILTVAALTFTGLLWLYHGLNYLVDRKDK